MIIELGWRKRERPLTTFNDTVSIVDGSSLPEKESWKNREREGTEGSSEEEQS